MNKVDKLIRMIKSNDKDGVKALIEKTFFKRWLLNSTDKEGATPLLYAVRDADEAMVMYLMHKGANVNKKGKNKRNNSPLSIAILTKNFSMLELLLTHPEIDLDIEVGPEKCNLLDFAAQSDNIEFIKNYGVNHFEITNQTIRLYFKYNSENINLGTLDFLLKASPDINEPIIVDKDYHPSLLEIAAAHLPIEVVELLLKKGADPNYIDKTSYIWQQDSSRTLGNAIRSGDLEKVKLLIKHGTYVNPCGVLFTCAINDKLEIMKYFLDTGIDPNPVTFFMFKSETLLEYTTRVKKIKITKLLMEYINE